MVRKITRLALAARGGVLGARGLGLMAACAAERPKRLENASHPKPQEMLCNNLRRVKMGGTELQECPGEFFMSTSFQKAEFGGVVKGQAKIGPSFGRDGAGLGDAGEEIRGGR